ncbi:MAG: hypothetical protein OEW77_01890 [Gemmatimonadota bacterium]|nr:hypothetical protein [Gemmatimonadota bacterium]
MTRFPRTATLALIAVAACSGAKSDGSGTAASTPNDAQRAAAIEQAVRAAPMKTDSILSANGLTADELEQMMYRVAADSALSAEYRRLTAR